MPIDFITQLLSIATIFGQIILLAGILIRVFRRELIDRYFDKYLLSFAFIVALASLMGSLFYSEIALYEPCKLCWIERIFIYPQVVLLGIAAWKKDRGIALYSLALSLIGTAIISYHYLLEFGLVPSLPCSAADAVVSCAKRYVLTFGYVTLPLMGLTAFLMIDICMFLVLNASKRASK